MAHVITNALRWTVTLRVGLAVLRVLGLGGGLGFRGFKVQCFGFRGEVRVKRL